eukprot:6187070-Pleurochrysis_carterae.AAC.1
MRLNVSTGVLCIYIENEGCRAEMQTESASRHAATLSNSATDLRKNCSPANYSYPCTEYWWSSAMGMERTVLTAISICNVLGKASAITPCFVHTSMRSKKLW